MLVHPAVWTAVDGLTGFVEEFGSLRVEEIQDRLEHGSGALLLRGFSLDNHSKDSARNAFLEWSRTLGTSVSQ